jgi:glycosyltransferase involved in cell wall biosynthesis
MNILMMSNTYAPIVGGIEKSIAVFSDQFRRQGHRVIIAAPEYKGRPKNEQDVVRLPALQKFNGTDFSVNLPTSGKFSKLVEEFKPEIIHSHHPFLMGDLALRMAGQYQVPMVFTYHTMYEQYLHYLPVHNETVKRFVIELSVGYANLADSVIVPSESVRDVLLERGLTAPVHVVPTGIEVGCFSAGDGKPLRERFGISAGDFMLGHVGRLEPEKNLEFLSGCVRGFLKEHEEARFLVVGRGSLEKKIRQNFQSDGLGDRLHWAGVLEGQDLVDSYHSMDAFVFASHSETQGMVLVEAMAAGVPVIAVDAPGVREVLKDNRNGRMIKSDHREQFIAALEWLYALNKKKRKDLRQNARDTAEDFSMELCAKKMTGVYNQLISYGTAAHSKNPGPWRQVMDRMKTEWEMLKNLKEAGEAALKGGNLP